MNIDLDKITAKFFNMVFLNLHYCLYFKLTRLFKHDIKFEEGKMTNLVHLMIQNTELIWDLS